LTGAITAVAVLESSDSVLTEGERNAISTLASHDNLASLLTLWP
jgi:hypothetical protein